MATRKKIESINIKGYEVFESFNDSEYDITKNGKTIAHLREGPDYYNAYIIDAGGSINYEKKPKMAGKFKQISFLSNVINDIEDYYERKKCFI